MTPPQKINSLEIKDQRFFLNGDEIKGELSQKCINAYETHSDIDLVGVQGGGKWIEKQSNIKILFD